MTRLFTLIGTLVVAAGWGCASVSPPVRVDATRGDLEILAGKWSGEYAGDGVGARRGAITFTLVPGEDHAHGDVLMIPNGSNRAYERYRGGEPNTPPGRELPPPAESLTIRFVRVADGSVSGVLDSYWDPDRRTQATTTFHGMVKGNTIQGTFRTTFGTPAAAMTGEWKVTRRR